MWQPLLPSDIAARNAASKRKRRWCQFSLRSLLIATVIIAVLCGWLGSQFEQRRKQQEAVREVVKAGGDVLYDYERVEGDRHWEPRAEPPGPAWLRNLLGEDFFGDIEYVAFYDDATSTDAKLATIEKLISLRGVNLEESNVTDGGLEHLAGLERLEYLWLSRTRITNDGLVNLRRLSKLKLLNVSHTEITDDGLANLKRLTELEYLDLSENPLTDTALEHLNVLTGLKWLSLWGTGVTDAGVNLLQKALPRCKIYNAAGKVRGEIESSLKL
jgi:Leucine Rich repeat